MFTTDILSVFRGETSEPDTEIGKMNHLGMDTNYPESLLHPVHGQRQIQRLHILTHG